MTLFACTNPAGKQSKGEIFLSEFDTPFGMPDFNKINFDDFKPAFLKGMEDAAEEINAIAENPEQPTFENTVVALDNSGELLSRVSRVFGGLRSAESNDEIRALAVELSPLLSEHSDNIYMNDKLFERIKTIHDNIDNLDLNTEDARLLEVYYKRFVRSGIMLNEADKNRLREINKDLSALISVIIC